MIADIIHAVIASTAVFADKLCTTVTGAAIRAGLLLIINVAVAAVGTCHVFLEMALKAGVFLIRIAPAVTVHTAAADTTPPTGRTVHEACTTVFTDQISVFFKMAVIAEMVSTFGAHTAAGIITLAAVRTQIGVHTTLTTAETMDLVIPCTFHTHFAIFAELRVVGAFMTYLTMILLPAVSAAVGTAVVTAGADPVVTGSLTTEFTFHIDVPRIDVEC